MFYKYRIYGSLGLLVDRFEGKVGWRELLEGTMRSARDPAFRAGLNVLIDLTDADMDVGFEGMRTLVEETDVDPTVRYERVAIVAPTSLQYGLVRMYDALAQNYRIHRELSIFPNISGARAWLELPENVDLDLLR